METVKMTMAEWKKTPKDYDCEMKTAIALAILPNTKKQAENVRHAWKLAYWQARRIIAA